MTDYPWWVWAALATPTAFGLALLIGAFIRWWAPLDIPEATEEQRQAVSAASYLEGP